MNKVVFDENVEFFFWNTCKFVKCHLRRNQFKCRQKIKFLEYFEARTLLSLFTVFVMFFRSLYQKSRWNITIGWFGVFDKVRWSIDTWIHFVACALHVIFNLCQQIKQEHLINWFVYVYFRKNVQCSIRNFLVKMVVWHFVFEVGQQFSDVC